MNKSRLDEELLRRNLCTSLHEAQSLIMAGDVVVNYHRQTALGFQVKPYDKIRIKTQTKYVSRGGLKLEAALRNFDIDLTGRRSVDLGSSTGGFSDCMLKHGAKSVTAVDVNYGQFDWSLRQDRRVSLYERLNVKGICPQNIGGPFDFAAGDLSFISLTSIFADVFNLLNDGKEAVLLIKPQFEAKRKDIDTGGIVRDKQTHIKILNNVLCSSSNHGFSNLDLCYSPIKGTKGNIEYLVHLLKNKTSIPSINKIKMDKIDDVVNFAFHDLGEHL